MNKIVTIDNTDYAWCYFNYIGVKQRSTLDMNCERYEGYMRSDFCQIKCKTEMVYDKLELVKK